MTDNVALADMLPFFQTLRESRQVAVNGGIRPLMLQEDDITVPILPARNRHDPIGSGLYPRARWRGIVYPFMSTPCFQDWMETTAGKTGTDTGKFQR